LEIDDDGRLPAHRPCVVAGWEQRNVAGLAVEFSTIVHANVENARNVILKVWRLTAFRFGDGLDGICPSPSRFKYGASHRRAADLEKFESSIRKLANLVWFPEAF